MHIYLDVFILLNLSANTLILLLTAWLLRLPYRRRNLSAAVCVAVFYAVAALWYHSTFLFHPMMKLLLSILILRIAFSKQAWRQFFLTLGTFYLVSFLLGGAVFGYSFFLRTAGMEGTLENITRFHLLPVLQGLALGASLLYVSFQTIGRRRTKAAYFGELALQYGEKEITVRSFWDSGNQMYTLGGGKPVILIERTAIAPLFSPAVRRYLEETKESEWIDRLAECGDELWKRDIVLISYRSIGSADLLLGCRVGSVRVRSPGQDWRSFDCVAGIYSGQLSPDESYQALLHASMSLE